VNCRSLLLIFLLLFTVQANAASFTGKLVKVLDGDTVEVMHDGKAERIRLAQIDCPEKNQPFGQAASNMFWMSLPLRSLLSRLILLISTVGPLAKCSFLMDLT